MAAIYALNRFPIWHRPRKTKKKHVKNGAPVGERPSSLYSEAKTTATTPTLDSPKKYNEGPKMPRKKRVSHWVKVSPIELHLDVFIGRWDCRKKVDSLFLIAQSNAGSFKCFCVTGLEYIFYTTLRLRIWNNEKISYHIWIFFPPCPT